LVDRGDTNGIRAGTRRELPIIRSGKAKDDCLPGMTLSFRATPPLRSPPSTRLGSVPDCPVAYNHRGTDPHALGGLKAAVADFDRGFELAPGYAEVLQEDEKPWCFPRPDGDEVVPTQSRDQSWTLLGAPDQVDVKRITENRRGAHSRGDRQR
jgi:hypothetical protein